MGNGYTHALIFHTFRPNYSQKLAVYRVFLWNGDGHMPCYGTKVVTGDGRGQGVSPCFSGLVGTGDGTEKSCNCFMLPSLYRVFCFLNRRGLL